MDKNKIKKLLKLIDKIYQQNNSLQKRVVLQKGRIKTYDDFCIFKIYLLMNILNIKSIKGIWQFLNENPDIRKKCGLKENLDRTTLNRRLNSIYRVL